MLTGQYKNCLNAIRWASNYFIKCHVSPNEFYGQVGDFVLDHEFWGRPEELNMSRPAYKIDKDHPGEFGGEGSLARDSLTGTHGVNFQVRTWQEKRRRLWPRFLWLSKTSTRSFPSSAWNTPSNSTVLPPTTGDSTTRRSREHLSTTSKRHSLTNRNSFF